MGVKMAKLDPITKCPLDTNAVYLYSTEDPDVVAEVTLYRKDIRISDIEKRVTQLDQEQEPEDIIPPANSSEEIKLAVSTYNFVIINEKGRIRQNKTEAGSLREWLDRVKTGRTRLR